MFLGGFAQGMGQGFQNVAKGQMDREKFNQLKEQGEYRKQVQPKQLELLNNQVKSIQNTIDKQNMMMLRDGSYDMMDKFVTDIDKETGLPNPEYLNAAFVRAPILNKQMAARTGLKQITDIKFDETNGNITFVDGLSGKEVSQPAQVMLASLGYFSKRDKLENDKASSGMKNLLSQLKIKSEVLGQKKTGLEIEKKEGEVKPIRAEETAKKYLGQDLLGSDNSVATIAYEEIKPNLSGKQTENYNSSQGKQLLDLTKRADDLLKETKTYKVDASVESELKKLWDNYSVLSQDKNATTEQIATANFNMLSSLQKLGADNNAMMLLADYIKLKSGAAFSAEELSMAKSLIGIGPGQNYQAQVKAREGFRDNLATQAKLQKGGDMVGDILFAKDYQDYVTTKEKNIPRNITTSSGKTFDIRFK